VSSRIKPGAEVVDRVKNADIGLMPLVDTPWNRCKCSIKALESMAMGLPTVLSSVGENNFVADYGDAALLADNSEQWYQHLKRLVTNSEVRAELGAKGRRVVLERYTPEVVFNRALVVLKALDVSDNQ